MGFIAAGLFIAGSTLAGGIYAGATASNNEKKARNQKNKINKQLEELEKNRQEIINPWANTENLSSLATDLSYLATSTVENITNQYKSLGVATQASEFQAEQADISLANTLDMLRSTGASAGGATALAQAALQSKRGVSANIEAQEAQVQKLRAQGQMETDRFNAQAQMNDAQRIQSVQINEGQRIQSFEISEAQRLQAADVKGQQFMFNAQENRDNAHLDRLSGISTNYANQEMAAQQDKTTAILGTINAFGNMASSMSQPGMPLNPN